MEFEMVVYSDNSEIKQVRDVLNDNGYKTVEVRKESIGRVEEENEWNFAKLNMMNSVCVDLFHHIGQVVPTEQVEEKPLFRYVAVFIVGDDDDTDDTEREENEMAHDIDTEKEISVVMNIGLTTQDGKALDMDTVINMIGLFADCTITPTIGFYKGKRENSLKVEIYGYKATAAFTLAAHFARSFNQECVALTANGYTAFIPQQPTNDEYKEFVARVDK